MQTKEMMNDFLFYLSINNPFLKSLSNGIGARFSSVSNKCRNASRAAISSATEIVAPAPKTSFHHQDSRNHYLYFFREILY